MAPAVKPEDLGKECFFGLDAESIRKGLLIHLEFTLAELPKQVDSEWEPYLSLALTVRDRSSSGGVAPRAPTMPMMPGERCQLNRSLQHSLIGSSDDVFQRRPIFWAALN